MADAAGTPQLGGGTRGRFIQFYRLPEPQPGEEVYDYEWALGRVVAARRG